MRLHLVPVLLGGARVCSPTRTAVASSSNRSGSSRALGPRTCATASFRASDPRGSVPDPGAAPWHPLASQNRTIAGAECGTAAVPTRQRWGTDDDSRIQSWTMHMFFRTLLHVLFLSRRKPDLGHYDVARTNFITLPTDLDINRHMNNGVYFSIMDVARFDMLVRNGVWRAFREQGLVPGRRERDDHVPQVAEPVAALHDRVEARRLRRQGRLHGAALRATRSRRRARGVRPGVHPRAVPAQDGRHRAGVRAHRGVRRARGPGHPRVDRALGRGCRAAGRRAPRRRRSGERSRASAGRSRHPLARSAPSPARPLP